MAGLTICEHAPSIHQFASQLFKAPKADIISQIGGAQVVKIRT